MLLGFPEAPFRASSILPVGRRMDSALQPQQDGGRVLLVWVAVLIKMSLGRKYSSGI